MPPSASYSPTMAKDIQALFNAQVKKIERRNYEGKIFYHPVQELKDWMADSNFSNTRGLLATVESATGQTFPLNPSHNLSKSLIVFAILLRLNCGHLLHIFRDKVNDNMIQTTFPKEQLKTALDASHLMVPDDILERFEEQRRAFHPLDFEDIINHEVLARECWMLPFCVKEEAGVGGTAEVARVLIQESLVPQEFRLKHTSSLEVIDKEFGKCFQFALKTYDDDSHTDVYNREIDNFRGVGSLKGVVDYYGCFVFTETDGDGNAIRTTANILLEYGELDLDEYLAGLAPPSLNSEIIAFWDSVFAVATTLKEFHSVEVPGSDGQRRRFAGIHGDIKPDNILFTKWGFKLLDFGFAHFERTHDDRDVRAVLQGVTHTYGAPECVTDRVRRNTTEHTQEIDTWSFGCVLSAIATWVIHGSRAYKDYQLVRKLAIKGLREKNVDNPNALLPKADDAFHDGRRVLAAVEDWHQYLRNTSRRSDTLTMSVLNLVEKKMLQAEPKKRLSSAKLDKELRRLLEVARTEYKTSVYQEDIPEVPDETLQALLALDSLTPPDRNQVPTASDAPIGQYLIRQHRETHTQTSRTNKTERLGSVPEARVARRQEALQRELSERGVPVDSLGIIFKSPVASPMQAEHSHAKAVAPVEIDGSPSPLSRNLSHNSPVARPSAAQMGSESGRDPFTTGHQGNSSRGEPAKIIFTEPALSTTRPPTATLRAYVEQTGASPSNDVVSQPQSQAPLSHSPTLYTDRIPPLLSPVPSYQVASNPPRGADTTNSQGTSHAQPDLHTSTPRIVAPHPESYYHPAVAPRPREPTPSIISRPSTYMDPSGYQSLPIGTLFAKLEVAWKENRTMWNKLRDRVPADEKLKNFIQGRDIVFLVDNGWHMREHWDNATVVLQALGMQIGPLDKDGLDVYFTIDRGHYAKTNVKNFDIPKQFRSAMQNAKASDDMDMYATPMAQALRKVLWDYLNKDMPKKQTLIVLTTGVWDGMKDDAEVEVAAAIKEMMRRLQSFYLDRWFGIEFVSFGDNMAGLSRLQGFDDNMKRFGVPDVIDHEPWTGDPNKMILGSLKDSMDNKTPTGAAQNASDASLPAPATYYGQFEPRLRPDSRASRGHSGSSIMNRLSGVFGTKN